MSVNPITLLDIKAALKDPMFRSKLPDALNPEVKKYLDNPGCACNVPLYQKIMSDASDLVQNYFPNKTLVPTNEKMETLARNSWNVINCHVDEIELKLRMLGHGRKQIAIARYEDQATIVVNELDFIY
jgi:hypothetical protein